MQLDTIQEYYYDVRLGDFEGDEDEEEELAVQC